MSLKKPGQRHFLTSISNTFAHNHWLKINRKAVHNFQELKETRATPSCSKRWNKME